MLDEELLRNYLKFNGLLAMIFSGNLGLAIGNRAKSRLRKLARTPTKYGARALVQWLAVSMAVTLLGGGSLSAQTLPPNGPENALFLAGRSFVDSVRLRWAPSNYAIWSDTWAEGVHLDRYTLMRDGATLPDAERQRATRLTIVPIKPAPEAAFGNVATAGNRFAGIAGQAIYGERFDVGTQDPGPSSLFNRAKEQSNRFGFGLYAADQDWATATMMGLAFTDRTALRNEVYVYRLVPVDTDLDYDDQRSGFVSVVVNDNAPTPPVQEFDANFADRQVALRWDLEVAANFYSSYWIERSADGLSWTNVNHDGLPFVPLVKPGEPLVAVFSDSLPQNNRPYFYRVMGRTPFGEMGPPTDPVQGMGLDPQPTSPPSLVSLFPTKEGGINVAWSFATENPIQGFRVERAGHREGPYEPISDVLGTEVRDFTDPAPLMSNYYQVTVLDQYGRSLTSYPALAQPEDNEPPAVPTGLRGIILKDGRVILSWEENDEEDLLGYRVWLSNQPEVEYSLATGAPIAENYWVGETTMNTLSKKLYAKLVSLDLRHNTSDFTDYVELLRPDSIPPAPPLMTDLQARKDTILLTWAFSQSLDVARQELQRRRADQADTSWTVIASYEPPLADEYFDYADTGLERGIRYDYRLVATDQGELSASSEVLTGAVLDDFVREQVDRVRASANRREKQVELRWSYTTAEGNLSYFEVFRTTSAEAPPRRIGALPAGALERGGYRFVDEGPLRMDTEYFYQVRAVFADGALSPRSPVARVDY